MIIGVTGGSGTGKSSLAALLGYEVIDADRVYHELLAENKDLKAELIGCFGTCERKEMASIVFSDKSKLEELNSITFKYILAAIESRIPQKGDVVIDASVLFELGLGEKCDFTIAVLARNDLRINRIMERDGISREKAEMRVNAQKPDEYFIKSADHVVHNNGEDMAKTARKLKDMISEQIAVKFKEMKGDSDGQSQGNIKNSM